MVALTSQKTSQKTPKWSVGPLMSLVFPLQIPQRSEVDPSTKASKHLQNDEKEDDLFVLRFYNVISLGSLKKKEKQNLKKLFIYF